MNYFLWFFLLVLALLLLLAVKSVREYKRIGIPGPPPFPIIGNAPQIAAADSFMVLASQWISQYAGKQNVIQAFLFSKRLIIVGKNPEVVKDVYTSSAYIKGIIAKDFEPLLGKTGMIFSDGDIWARVRKICTGAFQKQHLRLFEDPIRLCANNLVEKLSKNISSKDYMKIVDMDEYFVQVTLDIMGRTMLSMDFESLNSPEAKIPHQVEIFLKESVHRVQNPLNFLVRPHSVYYYRNAIRYLKSYTLNIINQRIQSQTEKKTEDKDLLDLLLAAQDPESGVGLTKQEIQEQVLTFLLAGHETGAHTLSFTLSMISRYPEIAAKIQDELDQVLGKDSKATPSFEECNQLHYLTAVIKEGLRMFPIAPIIIRQLAEDRRVAGYDLPKGCLVLIDLIALHYDPETWDRPGMFIPERFLNTKSDSEGSTLNPFEYSPFGHSRRACLGQNFAMLEMKMILATILRRFRFEMAPCCPVIPLETVTIRPKGGLQMTLWTN